MRILSVAIAGLAVLLLSFAALTAPAQEEGEEVEIDEGTTTGDERFGPGIPAGWDYARVRSPSREAFVAVIWGKGATEAGKGAVWVVSSWTRTFASGQLVGPQGAEISKETPLKVRTYFLQRFDSIYEFSDSNGDGIANVLRTNRPIAESQVLAHEPVYKAVSLRTGWTKTNVTKTTETVNGTTAKVWSLTLTATDLAYGKLRTNASSSVGDNKLNKVEFTFHLKGWKEEGSVSLPVYKVTLNSRRTDDADQAEIEPQGTRTVTGNFTKVKAKEDHEIEGWDFDPQNSKAGLVLETHLAFGWAPDSRAAKWLGQRLIERDAKAGGQFSYRADNETSDTTTTTANESLPSDTDAPTAKDRVRKLGAGKRVTFGGDWDKTGALTWTSETDVWSSSNASATDGNVFFQVQGGRKFALGQVRGVMLMGGFSYAGGPYYKVRHDPESSVDMAEIETSEETSGKRRVPGFETPIVVASAALAAALAFRKR